MKHIASILFLTGLVLSCAKPASQPAPVDEYAFSVKCESVPGIVTVSGVKTAPIVSIRVTEGEDIDYTAIFSVDGGVTEFTQHNIWVGRDRTLNFTLADGAGDYGEHKIVGRVFRTDGNGIDVPFEVKYRMNTERVLDITSLELISSYYGYGTFETAMEDGIIRVPAADTGIACIKIYPEDASIAKLSSDNVLKLYTDKAVVRNGVVEIPYRTLKPGTGKVYADWGGGVYEKAVRSIQFPTVGLDLKGEYAGEVSSDGTIELYARLADYTNVPSVTVNEVIDAYNGTPYNDSKTTLPRDSSWHIIGAVVGYAVRPECYIALNLGACFVRIESTQEPGKRVYDWMVWGDLDGVWADNPDTSYFNEFATVTE